LRERRLSDVPGDSADLLSVAEEVLQETFLKLIESISSFRGESSLRTWLYKLAVNQALMVRWRRCQRPEEPLELLLPEFHQRGHLAKFKPNLSPLAQAAELLERRELLDLAHSARVLPPEESCAIDVMRNLESR
jgi:RNA polymerase sigma-70 factor (ECF subfamily)